MDWIYRRCDLTWTKPFFSHIALLKTFWFFMFSGVVCMVRINHMTKGSGGSESFGIYSTIDCRVFVTG